MRLGAGTSFSLLATLNEAHKIAELNSAPISALEGLYLPRWGGARALGLEDHVGSPQPGGEADVVLDPNATRLLSFRESRSRFTSSMPTSRLTRERPAPMVRP